MADKDVLKQNEGAQQGNLHSDADTGANDDGHAGSTLKKRTESERSPEDEHDNPKQGDTPSQGGKQETLGIP